MHVEDFDYELPEYLIAQTPLKKRSDSKLMVLNREKKAIYHHYFYELPDLLRKNDILVLNDTKVMPARLFGLKEKTKAHIEILMLKEKENSIWECLVKPAKRIHEKDFVIFGDGRLKAQCIQKKEDGICCFQFLYEGIFLEILDQLGEMPLPPYIHEKLEEKDRYNTVYARQLGSAAAPTAGLHFTKELLDRLLEKGIQIVYITLHVGLGTFRPVSVSNIEDHKMHSEYYEMSKEVAEILNQAKKEQRRIISVGTTSARTLETIMERYHEFREMSGWTDIFIKPGYQFQAIDALITNFHLPKSTLIMLVSAFSNREFILEAYREAISKEYRFFSFGDSMFIE